MTTSKQNTATHQCALPKEPKDIVKRLIDSGIFISLRRKLKRIFMISGRHPTTRVYVKSTKELRYEEKRHLVSSYYMIHPLSMFNFWFRVIVFISLLTEYFSWSIIAPYFTPLVLQAIFSVHNVIHVFLIILSFFVGHYKEDTNTVVLNSRKVALKYLTTYFLFDVVAFGIVILRYLLTIRSDWDLNWPIIRILRWTLPLFKFARYYYYLKTLKEMKVYFRLNHFLYLALRNACNLKFLLLFFNCVLFIILREFPHFTSKPAIKFAISSVEMFLMVDHGQHTENYMVDKITPIICILIGFVLHLILHVYVMSIWVQYFSTRNTHNTVYNSIEAYMRYRVLPNKMRKRISLYLDFRYQNHYYKDSSIMMATSSLLRKDILINISKECTEKVDIFKNFPEKVLQKLRARLVPVIFLPGDSIVEYGTKANNIYFIICGTVKVTSSKGKEVYRIRDGAHFGDISLILNLPRVAYVIAVTPCEIYVLSEMHFFQVLNMYPKLLAELRDNAKNKLLVTQSDGDDIEDQEKGSYAANNVK